jgi:REP element-mobilizing transposase RayT
LAVCTNHVHLLAKPCNDPIDKMISRYKSLTTRALWEYGRKEKIWTRGFDQQYCFTEKDLVARMTYILKHKE